MGVTGCNSRLALFRINKKAGARQQRRDPGFGMGMTLALRVEL